MFSRSSYITKCILSSMLSVAVCFAGGVLLYVLIANNGMYPSGSDTMYHVFRGSLLYDSLVSGRGLPLYDGSWYNGFAPMRYWPPLSPLFYSLCEWITGGDVFGAYIYYCVFIFIGGVFAWNIVGVIRQRPFMGVLLGILWFFIPNNIYAMFGEGNLPRSLSMVFLPLFLCFTVMYVKTGKWQWLLWSVISFVFIILCHLGYAGMVALAFIMYLVLYSVFNGFWDRTGRAILGMLTGFLLSGLYMMPSLHGGISLDNSETVLTFFQSILITLNPFYRITNSPVTFYFGLSVFIICVFGILASGKESVPGFLNAVIIVLLTTETACVAIMVLPLASIMWMLRFLSIGLCMAFFSLLEWKSLKKWILLSFVLLIIADSIPSLYWVVGDRNGLQPENRLESIENEILLKRAKEVCEQRIALFDLSSLGAEGAYLTACFDVGKPAVFGAGWEAAVTAKNITRLNKAMDDGYYVYMFTRCLEMGADTVLIQKVHVDNGEEGLIALDKAAEQCGYNIISENGGYMLYHHDVPGQFGTKSQYDAIGIGYSAYLLSFTYPSIKETDDEYLDHYSFAELSQYDTVYLSGFYYDDKVVAEDLVRKLAEAGVNVVILADGIPENKETRSKEFMNVTCNVIQFENGYPVFYTDDFGEIDCDLFPKGYAKWTTYYLNGLSDERGIINDNSVDLAFYGTADNKNIRFVGLNVPFYYYLTQDVGAGQIVSWMMGNTMDKAPVIDIVPLSVEYGINSIDINSKEDGVCTGLAKHDNFVTDQEVSVYNSMLVVDSGDTHIDIVYPYLSQGIVVTGFGIVCLVLLLWYSCFAEKVRQEEKHGEGEKEDQGGACAGNV